MKLVELSEVLSLRKVFINISDSKNYKLCRVQTNRKGVVLRENKYGSLIKTKKQQVCKHLDFIVAEMDAKVGGYGFIPEDLDNAIVSSHYFLFEVDFTKIRKEYFEAIIQTEIIQDQIKAKGSTNYSAIRPKDVLKWKIPLGTLAEQEKIEKSFLNTRNQSFKLLDELKNQKKLLSQLKQAILQEAIEGKLTIDWRNQNPEVEPACELIKRIKTEKEKLIKEKKIKKGKKQLSNDLGNIQFELPKTWLFADMDDISQYITDGTHLTPTYTEKGRIFLSAQNVKPFKFLPENHKYVSEEDYREYIQNRLAERGDLLVGRVGSKGETAVIDRDIEFAFYVSLGLIKTFKEFTSPEYLAIVMNSPYGNLYATGNMSSIGASAGNFNLGRIRSFPVPLPPFEEQKAIVHKVDLLMGKLHSLDAEIDQSDKHAQMLMQAVLKEAFEPSARQLDVMKLNEVEEAVLSN
ncbi:restriction endonuclease subunit S [Pontibacter lucknowensis]|uniref:Restriction endonuclease S subunit n=1 Tax=Pontibacter lucknowensis TaxID=1077936 RepID=A0A1N7A096_9BACT|nr:restriction endonuclease subunit S [Pontibacter lucknowensis]SIR32458.1 Restriction endonuclease S subunit [Pontibacter lucknowensis]